MMFEFLAGGGIPALIVILGYCAFKGMQSAYARRLENEAKWIYVDLLMEYKKGDMSKWELGCLEDEQCGPLRKRAMDARDRWDFWNA